MLRFNLRYFLCAIALFIAEVLIAAFLHDKFIRPTFGDFLVVLLMYCSIRTFILGSYRTISMVALCIAYAIEVSQYFHLIVHLGWQHSTPALLLLGSGFSWGDMLAYTLGAAFIWVVEARIKSQHMLHQP